MPRKKQDASDRRDPVYETRRLMNQIKPEDWGIADQHQKLGSRKLKARGIQ